MLTVTNPYDGSEVGRLPLADEAAIDAAVTAAHTAFDTTRATPPHERARILSNAAHALRGRKDEFAQLIVAEAGKPIVLAETEVDRAVNTLTAASEEARRASQGEWLDLDGYPPGKGHVGFVRRFPVGVIYGITPFNFPLNLVLHKVAPAVASGNTIVVKPSPRTPLTALKLESLLLEAGCPTGQVKVVVCPNELARRPVFDVRVRHVSFTGSAPVGWELKRVAPPEKRFTLELGANSPLIVHDDADLDAAVTAAATGAFGYAGQSCISVQRIIVQRDVYDRFRELLVKYVREKVRTGDPRDRGVLVGPMIDGESLKRVRGAIDEALKSGAKLVIGNEVIGPCLTPTVLEDVTPAMAVCTSEIFAPVATLHPYDSFEHALAMANDSAYGLQAGVFTRDIQRAWKAFESLEMGGVLINKAPTWRVETMPYGGVKQSGFGREGVRYAVAEMTEPKLLVIKEG